MRPGRALTVAAILVLSLIFIPDPALADSGITYVVRPGDTLASIAAANGSTMQAIINANGLSNPDLLRVGQKLIIPRGTAAPSAGPARPSTYVVQRGQTLAQIARLLGVSLAVIVNANGLSNPDLIYSGMVLRIPGTNAVTTGTKQVTDTRFIASISMQRCWLYKDGKLIGDWRCSSGRKEAPTMPGSYRIQSKINPAYASRWDFWMPYWMGLYYVGSTENGIHGLPFDPKTGRRTWEGLVGTPITYGCIMLDDVNAKTLFSVAYIGMPVEILP